jgi:hypothetical protein
VPLLAGPSFAQVHELPDSGVGVAVDDLAHVMVLDAQLSSEAQIGAVEADECGGHLLEAVELVDQLVDGEVTVAGEVTM